MGFNWYFKAKVCPYKWVLLARESEPTPTSTHTHTLEDTLSLYHLLLYASLCRSVSWTNCTFWSRRSRRSNSPSTKVGSQSKRWKMSSVGHSKMLSRSCSQAILKSDFFILIYPTIYILPWILPGRRSMEQSPDAYKWQRPMWGGGICIFQCIYFLTNSLKNT